MTVELLTPATASALLLIGAGVLHSLSLMCRKLPPARRPRRYPAAAPAQVAIDLAWIALFLAGMRLAWGLSTLLGVTAALLYFVVLPFAFQPPLARLLGFASFRDYLDATRRR